MWTLSRLKRNIHHAFIFFMALVLLILPFFFPSLAVVIYFAISIFYLLSNLIKIFLFFSSYGSYNPDDYYKKDNLKLKNFPVYSILLPVRKEKEFVLVNLLNSISNLDYPKYRLDIKLIVDSNDVDTMGICKKLLERFEFDLIVVPEFSVKSKPISCNYALKFIRGEYLTIYDAEDRPEKYQLKKALEKFNGSGDNVVCLQASLNYYNKYENCLTYYFSIEYSMWFDFTIKSIPKYASFFPVGGTSNHFKVDKLLELGGWDGYNVTEDAELGVRIARAGYRIEVLNSITEEEAPITVWAWLRQRTRWIKGFMQTYCEHLMFRRPAAIKSKVKLKQIRQLKLYDILVFNVFVGMSFFFFISILAIIINHVVILRLETYKFLAPIIWVNIISLLFMTYGSFILIVLKNRMRFKFLYFIFFPFYWVLHYMAAVWAIYGLLKTPFYWAKTEHGASKRN